MTKEYTAYCVKCKEKGVKISGPKATQWKTGMWAATGKHEKCGTKLNCIIGKTKPTDL